MLCESGPAALAVDTTLHNRLDYGSARTERYTLQSVEQSVRGGHDEPAVDVIRVRGICCALCIPSPSRKVSEAQPAHCSVHYTKLSQWRNTTTEHQRPESHKFQHLQTVTGLGSTPPLPAQNELLPHTDAVHAEPVRAGPTVHKSMARGRNPLLARFR